MNGSHRPALIRDPSTALSYGALGSYAFWLYAFGPAIALLRTELDFSYAVVGIYSAAWAAGSTATSAGYATVVGRVGRHTLLWGSSTVTILGAVVFVLTRDVGWTLIGALVMGSAGTAMQLTTQSILSDRHGERRGQALVEANIGAGGCAVLAPLALGGLAATVAGWRTAMALPGVVLALLFVAYRHYPREDGGPQGNGGRRAGSLGWTGRPRSGRRARERSGRRTVGPTETVEAVEAMAAPPVVTSRRGRSLSAACWVLCFLVGVGIAVEFCVIYFGSELLAARTSLSPTAATTAMTAFYGGILIGRLVGARVVRTPGRTVVALWVSVALTVAGLVVAMVATGAVVGVAGILVAGIGVANLFPLSLSLALAAAGPRTDTVNGLAQVIGGVLVVIAPFVLGTLADNVGLTGAFAIAPALALTCGALLAVSYAVERRGRGRHDDARVEP